jgi:predicted ATPase
MSEFVGREEELAELARLLAESHSRLITIVAAGGMGKTRLSLAAAREAQRDFADGVYFIELAKLSEVESILLSIAAATSYEFQKDEADKKKQFFDFVSNKQMLLVFDNYEHLLEGSGIVGELLKAAPDLKIIVTSRQRLNQEGETLFHLSGMDFPKWETPADALNYAAVKLFMNSAKRAKPSFELSEDNLDSVARICRLVAGMPLGIVLAAAWLGTLSVQEIAEELAQGIDFLEADGEMLPERQRSMRAVMAYSWKLMTEAEQVVFRKLAVFRGGFTRKAAEGITGANLRVLMSLVNKSLLRRDNDSERYEIHELLRQYAEEELELSGELEAVRDAHTSFYLKAVAERADYFKDHREQQAVRDIDKDFENLRAAWFWALQTEQFDELVAAIEALFFYGDIRNLSGDLLIWLQAVSTRLAAQGEIESLRYGILLVYQALIFIGIAENAEQQALGESYCETALAIGEKTQSHFLLFQAKRLWATYQISHGHYEQGIQVALELEKHAQELHSAFYIADSIQYYSSALGFLDDWGKLAELVQKSYELFKAIGHKSRIASTVTNLGVMAWSKGDYREAEGYAREALAMVQGDMNNAAIINYQLRLVSYLYEQGKFEEAEALMQSSYQFAQDLNLKWGMEWARNYLSSLAGAKGQYEEALSMIYQVYKFYEWDKNITHGYLIGPLGRAGDLVEMRRIQERAMPKLTPNEFYLYMERRQLIFDLLPLIRLDWGTERATECLSLLIHNPKAVQIFAIHAYSQKCRKDYELELGKDAFEAAWERGKSLDIEDLIPEIKAQYAKTIEE